MGTFNVGCGRSLVNYRFQGIRNLLLIVLTKVNIDPHVSKYDEIVFFFLATCKYLPAYIFAQILPSFKFMTYPVV